MEAFVVAPLALLAMLSGLLPLILLGVVVYFLVQIKRAVEDISAELRDTRAIVRDAATKLSRPASQSGNP